MYLLVIVTLVIGILGVYAQVLALQASRYASSLTALGNNMVLWHSAAVSMGAGVVKAGGATYPCSLTYTFPTLANGLQTNLTAPYTCKPSAGSGTVTGGGPGYTPNLLPGGEAVHLPPGYNTVQDQFFSILYQDPPATGQYYVVTFVPPATLSATNPAPGYLSLPPSGNPISYTANDLLHQLSLVGIPDYSYGTVVTNGTNTVSTLSTRGVQNGSICVPNPAVPGTYICPQYNMPMNGTAVLKTGTVAIVSSTAGF